MSSGQDPSMPGRSIAHEPAARSVGPRAAAPLSLTSGPINPIKSGEFDALADLFMGGQNWEAASAPPLPLVGGSNPAPLSSGSPVAGQRASGAGGPSLGFVPAEGSHGASRACGMEAVVLGHLPVMAAGWLGQYARQRAVQLRGNLAVVRITGDWVRIEVVSPTVKAREALPSIVAAGDGQQLGKVAKLLRGHLAGVLVSGGVADEHRLIGQGEMHDVTLLTGGDEASTIAAYRVIKGIALGRRHNAGAGAGIGAGSAQGAEMRPGFRLVVVGAPQAHAMGVWRRLSEATRTFLGVEMEMAGTIERLAGRTDTGAGLLCYDGPLTESIEKLLNSMSELPAVGGSAFSLKSHLTAPASPASPVSSPSPTPLGSVAGAAGARLDDAVAARADQASVLRALAAAGRGPVVHQGQSATDGPMATTLGVQPPEPTAHSVLGAGSATPAAVATGTGGPSAAAGLGGGGGSGGSGGPGDGSDVTAKLLGLVSLGLGCPVAPEVSLCLDHSGVLHAVVEAGAGAAAHRCAALSLLRVRTWTLLHRAILERLTGHPLAADRHPILHLVSRDGREAADLDLAEIQVHVRAAVPAGAAEVMVALS